jgi:hypothetical protein
MQGDTIHLDCAFVQEPRVSREEHLIAALVGDKHFAWIYDAMISALAVSEISAGYEVEGEDGAIDAFETITGAPPRNKRERDANGWECGLVFLRMSIYLLPVSLGLCPSGHILHHFGVLPHGLLKKQGIKSMY